MDLRGGCWAWVFLDLGHVHTRCVDKGRTKPGHAGPGPCRPLAVMCSSGRPRAGPEARVGGGLESVTLMQATG